jgi:hypothetical protein
MANKKRNYRFSGVVMTPMELQDRAQYLSLALFSQKIVSILMEYVDENKSAKLRSSLDEVLESLLQTKHPSSSNSKIAAFSSYEHLRTLEEVWTPRDRVNAIRMIRVVRRAPQKPKTKDAANELIRLFSELQNQALWNFEQPKPVSQRVIQRLCQTA